MAAAGGGNPLQRPPPLCHRPRAAAPAPWRGRFGSARLKEGKHRIGSVPGHVWKIDGPGDGEANFDRDIAIAMPVVFSEINAAVLTADHDREAWSPLDGLRHFGQGTVDGDQLGR